MTDKTSHILYLKEQVLRFASAIGHKHTVDDIIDISSKYAPKNHASTSISYGKGTDKKYGHLKINNDVVTVNEESPVDETMPVSVSGIISYVTKEINDIADILRAEFQNKLNIKTSINSDSTHKSSNIYNIPTTKAVWDAISSYEDLLEGVSLAKPKQTSLSLDQLVEPGYYMEMEDYTFLHGNETIYYKNGLIKVEKSNNIIIQHVYSVDKNTKKLNSCEYTRKGSNGNWDSWYVTHKPYTKYQGTITYGTGVDQGSIEVYENTAGFIIKWNQTNNNQQRYPITAPLYEFTRVCSFNPPLPIDGPYVFGNLIGRMDIRITNKQMDIRSTVVPGGRIIEMHETYFVPRNN